MDDILTFAEKKDYKVKTIIKNEKYFVFETADEKIEVPTLQYNGKMPPIKKFFGHHELKTKVFFKELVYAEVDGVVIYCCKEEKLPDNLKRLIARYRAWEITSAEEEAERQRVLLQHLDEFVRSFPVVDDLESELSKQPLMFRAWLKPYFYAHHNDENVLRRLSLLLQLTKIAEIIYRRYNHVSLEESPRIYGIYSLAKINTLDIEVQIAVENDLNIPYRYSECLELLRKEELVSFKNLDDILLQHFAWTLRRILILYVCDREDFRRRMSFDRFYVRLYSDQEEYIRQWKKLKLWTIDTQILPALDEKKMSDFLNDYAL